MRRILLLSLCFFALTTSAQGAFSRGVVKGLEKVNRYKYPIAGGSVHQLEEQIGRNQHLYLYQYPYSSQINAYQYESPTTLPITSNLPVQSKLEDVKGNENVAEKFPTSVYNSAIADELSSDALQKAKQPETDNGYGFVAKLLCLIGGLFAFCVVGIVVASYFEKKKSNTSTQIPYSETIAANYPKRKRIIYLAKDLGVIIR